MPVDKQSTGNSTSYKVNMPISTHLMRQMFQICWDCIMWSQNDVI